MAILFKKHIVIYDWCSHIPGRMLTIKAQLHTSKEALVNIYAPNLIDKQETFYSSITNILTKEFAHDELIVGGDFNIIMDPKLDQTGGLSPPKKDIDNLTSMLQTVNLYDIWRDYGLD